MEMYERLSHVYDLEWSRFAETCVSFIVELLRDQDVVATNILDLACGTGTLAAGLARRGYTVTGIDRSQQMINVAQAKSETLPNVAFHIADMTTFSVGGSFDLVTCTFDSLNYLLTQHEILAMLKRVRSVLSTSGLFVFDSNTEHLYLARHSGTLKPELGGETFYQELHYDPTKRETRTVFRFSDGECETHIQRPYDLAELRPLLADSGLQVVASYSGLDRTPYTPDSERLVCVAGIDKDKACIKEKT